MKKALFVLAMLLVSTALFQGIVPVSAEHVAVVSWVEKEPTHPDATTWCNEWAQNELYIKKVKDVCEWPRWLNFTIYNKGPDSIIEAKLFIPKTDDVHADFRFCNFEIHKKWRAVPDEFDPDGRPTIIHFICMHVDDPIKPGDDLRIDCYCTEGPLEEDCWTFLVYTIDSGDPSTNCYELIICIDNTPPPPPTIISPDDETKYQDLKSPVRIKAKHPEVDGNSESKKSGFLRLELWINHTRCYIMNYDKIKDEWWIDLTDDMTWQDESWWELTVAAKDKVQPDECNPCNPCQNHAEDSITIFVIEWTDKGKQEIRLEPEDKDGRGYGAPCWRLNPNGDLINVIGVTGFWPHTEVIITLDSLVVNTTETDYRGKFKTSFRVPELPRGNYTVTATDKPPTPADVHRATYELCVVPSMCSLSKYEGNVGDEVCVSGKGWAPNAWIDIYYRDVMKGDVHNDWAKAWNWTHLIEWKPYLDDVKVASKKSNSKGSFEVCFNVPDSYAGYHPIYAKERDTGVRGGYRYYEDDSPFPWPQSLFFEVKPEVWTEPNVGINDQFITIYGTGLPLPSNYSLNIKKYMRGPWDKDNWKYEWKTTYKDRELCLLIDFLPVNQSSTKRKYWVFENNYILNNEFDFPWSQGLWQPFSYYGDGKCYNTESPAWNGTLCSLSFIGIYENGSRYLKVPLLAHVTSEIYNITVYQWDKNEGKEFWDYKASATFAVLKDPLNVWVESGTLYFPGEIVTVYAKTDVDGVPVDVASISFKLYHGSDFLQELTSTNIDKGLYAASFTCPEDEGNYLIAVSASESYDAITMQGNGVAGFTISPTLNGLNARLLSVEGDVATIETEVGTIKVDLEAIEVSITEIKGKVGTIQSDIGTMQVSLDDINALITGIQGKMVTIESDIGTVQTDISDINGKLSNFEGDIATIQTDIGTFKASLEDINTKISATNDNIVTVQTDVGTIKGKVSSIEGDVATINTDLGTLTTKTNSVNTNASFQPASTVILLIAAISAFAAAVMTFRKMYQKQRIK